MKLLLIALGCAVGLAGRPVAAQYANPTLVVNGQPVMQQGPDGQAIYREECRSCHGIDGKPTKRALGQYKNIPTFDAAFLAKVSEDSIVAVLRHGAGKDMKSFKDKLSAAEIAAVAKYVKSGLPAGQ